MKLGWVFLLGVLVLASTPTANAWGADAIIHLNPNRTNIEFWLVGHLHDTRGRFALKDGTIHVDADTGLASGRILIDARSGDSKEALRDAIMKNGVLEVRQYPDIVFFPKQVGGTRDADGEIHGWITGLLQLHGDSRELRVLLSGRVEGQRLTAVCQFLIPYTQWGVESPNGLTSRQIIDATKAANVGSGMFSLFAFVLPILREIPPNLFGVSDFVQLNLETAGQISWASDPKNQTLTVIPP